MADIYGSLAGFKTYHNERDNDIATLDDDDILAALLRASEWIDGAFIDQFGGLKTGGRDQIREWPRTGTWDIYGYSLPSDTVPREVENAAYEAALKEAVTPGSLVVDYTPGKYKRVSVDGAVSVEYAGFTSATDIQTQFTKIGQILYPILAASGGAFSSLSGSVSRV